MYGEIAHQVQLVMINIVQAVMKTREPLKIKEKKIKEKEKKHRNKR